MGRSAPPTKLTIFCLFFLGGGGGDKNDHYLSFFLFFFFLEVAEVTKSAAARPKGGKPGGLKVASGVAKVVLYGAGIFALRPPIFNIDFNIRMLNLC